MNSSASTVELDRDNLVSLIARSATPSDIARHLDALDEATRLRQVRAVDVKGLRTLWETSKGFGEIDLAGLAPEMDRTVIYEGKNGLPVLSTFQKRFFRAASGETLGYNHNAGAVMLFSGPGYFLVEDAPEGEVLFDYTRRPSFVPADWPPYRPNAGLIAGAVFGGMKDYLRRVSRDTFIGAAFIAEKPRNQYFMLTLGR